MLKFIQCTQICSLLKLYKNKDVDGVTHVVNYDFPNTSEDYIHRIGRTGRQTNKGVSHTILTDENARQAKSLIEVMQEANQEIPRELADLAAFYNLSKEKDRQPKWKPRQNNYQFYKSNYQYDNNRRFNRFRSNKRNRYDDDDY